jgi:5-(carboxyamino)imidazole ribonucleotide synthase
MTTVGIVGAGQLGQMLGMAGRSLNVDCVFLDPAPNPPASSVADVLPYPFDDARGLGELAALADVLTYEFENVPVEALRRLTADLPVYPPTEALRKAQDRLEEKSLFQALDIPTAEFRNVESAADLYKAIEAMPLPLVLKTRRFGYDGKGQSVVHDPAQAEAAWQELGGVPLIAEQFIPFDREVSAIGVRSVSGEIATYPLTENVHRDGILRTSLAPAGSPALRALAESYHSRLLARLDYVGVLTLELFVVGDRLLANEFAPRVHNSGHWTIEGALTSQFENHLRAILARPLGDTSARGFAAMVNLIGTLPARLGSIRQQGFSVHEYGKSPRPGRKLGHITLVADRADQRDAELERLKGYLNGS